MPALEPEPECDGDSWSCRRWPTCSPTAAMDAACTRACPCRTGACSVRRGQACRHPSRAPVSVAPAARCRRPVAKRCAAGRLPPARASATGPVWNSRRRGPRWRSGLVCRPAGLCAGPGDGALPCLCHCVDAQLTKMQQPVYVRRRPLRRRGCPTRAHRDRPIHSGESWYRIMRRNHLSRSLLRKPAPKL